MAGLPNPWQRLQAGVFPGPHQTEGQIVLHPSTNIVVGQIEVQVAESHLPGAAFTLDEVPFVERRLVPFGDD